MPDINLNIDSGPSAYTDERIRDLVASFVSAGTDVNVTHDDANDTLTIDNPDGYSAEKARDDIADALSGSSGITVTHDDANDTITIDTSALLDGQDFDGQGTSQLSNVQSIDTERGSVTSEVVRIFGVNSSQQSVTYSDYALSGYTDIGDLLTTAISDLLTAGIDAGKAVIPVGEFKFNTQIEVDIPLTVEGQGKGQELENGATILKWTGGSSAPIVLRGTDDSPVADEISGVVFRDFSLVPDSGTDDSDGIFLDGTSDTNTDGSIVKNIVFENISVNDFQNHGVFSDGTVFRVSVGDCIFKDNGGDGVHFEHSAGSRTAGAASQLTIRDSLVHVGDNASSWGYDLTCNNIRIVDGTVIVPNAGNGIAARSYDECQVRGTRLDGSSSASTGILLKGPGSDAQIFPTDIGNFSTGVSVGETGNNSSVYNSFICFNPSANGDDVKIADTGSRENTHLLSKELSVNNEALSNDDDNYLVPEQRTYVETNFSIAIDSTGLKTQSVFPDHLFNRCDYFQVVLKGTSDGVADWAATMPIVDSIGTGIDVSVEVTTASATGGATATYSLVSVMMTHNPTSG